MAAAKERAQALAQELREALHAARNATARARSVGEEFKAQLRQVQAEAEAARNIVEYPGGRYECKACHQPVIFTETQRELPPCETCGRSAGYDGPRPKVLQVIPEAPHRFPAGLYECTHCHATRAVVEGVDDLGPCEFCGKNKLRKI